MPAQLPRTPRVDPADRLADPDPAEPRPDHEVPFPFFLVPF